jgi:hypothetical protein
MNVHDHTNATPSKQADRIENDIMSIQDRIGDLIGELNTRRKDALDIKFQLRKHPKFFIVAGIFLLYILTHTFNGKHRVYFRWRE